MLQKHCNTCNQDLLIDQFYKSGTSKDGHQYSCKTCAKRIVSDHYTKNKRLSIEKAKRWAERNPEKRKDIAYKSRLKRDFGITLEQYKEMLVGQNGRCKICNSEGSGGRSTKYKLFVDHCHKTNKIRGLLCMKCNSGIAYFNDQPERLLAAIKYLERTD